MRKDLKEKHLEAIGGMNPDRDFSILEYQALHPDATYCEIKEYLKLDITEDRVGQIVTEHWDIVLKLFASENYLYASEGRAYERAKAYFRKQKKGILTRKDPLDILNDMEDDKMPEVNISNVLVNVKEMNAENIRTQHRVTSEPI